MSDSISDLRRLAAEAGELATPTLVVDLDGTLIAGDTLWESVAIIARRTPLALPGLLPALFKGRAAFKKAVADRARPALADLAVNREVLDFIREEARSRPVMLATAAEARVAAGLADEFGCFSTVLATSEGVNLKGEKKLEAIKARLAADKRAAAFDYIGDSPADRPVWRAARRAYVVARTPARAQRVIGQQPVERRFEGGPNGLRAALKAMRLHQWTKNLLIFAPLFLSHQILDFDKIALAAAAFIAFSLTASATYIWNDFLDIQSDRAHARKKERPLASGALSIPGGLALSFGLLAVAFGLSLVALPLVASALIAGYIAITLSYSLLLKRKLFVDALTLALLYGYRIVVGAAATSILVSDWLIAFSAFFFCGLALVKRYSEIDSRAADDGEKISGRGYYKSDREIVSTLGVSSSFVSILIMALYITSPDVTELYSRPRMLWAVCLVMIYWVGRVWTLAHRGHMPDDPIVFALKDRNSLFCGLVCAGAVMLAAL